ncbi:MAG: hypothetical protein JXA43_01410 [Candidatus Diapherotrites archaeon]|nr:hypothetical protein [Candidatus Diapherotrites archaeon]
MGVNYPFLRELFVAAFNQTSEIANTAAQFVLTFNFPNLFIFVFVIITFIGILKVLKMI